MLAAHIEARLHTAEVEQIVDERGDVLHAVLNPLEKIALVFVQLPGAFHQFGVADDRCERRTQVV